MTRIIASPFRLERLAAAAHRFGFHGLDLRPALGIVRVMLAARNLHFLRRVDRDFELIADGAGLKNRDVNVVVDNNRVPDIPSQHKHFQQLLSHARAGCSVPFGARAKSPPLDLFAFCGIRNIPQKGVPFGFFEKAEKFAEKGLSFRQSARI